MLINVIEDDNISILWKIQYKTSLDTFNFDTKIHRVIQIKSFYCNLSFCFNTILLTFLNNNFWIHNTKYIIRKKLNVPCGYSLFTLFLFWNCLMSSVSLWCLAYGIWNRSLIQLLTFKSFKCIFFENEKEQI